MVDDQAQFCPKCGGAAVDSQTLVGGSATCGSCGWAGKNTELMTHTFKHDLGSNQEVMAAFLTDFKNLMAATAAAPLARLLMKWGFFMGEQATPQELARYIRAMALASVKALFDERREIEKERVGRGN